MELSNLPKTLGSQKKKKRIGRGAGSGKGFHTTGSGTKGQKARTGHSLRSGFDGAQKPLFMKLPKIKGFRNPRSNDIATVSLSVFNKFDEGTQVTPDLLLGVTLKSIPRHGVKILANGNLDKKLVFSGFILSKSSADKIINAGGEVKQ